MKIDNEFRDLIPELDPAELFQLEENIKRDGCRDPLVLWNGVLVDGHNRYDICTRNDIPFQTIERAFENRSQVIEWIITNQFGRRNLNPYIRGTLAIRLGSEIAARAKANLKTSSGGKNPQPLQISAEAVDTRKELAKLAGVSHKNISKKILLEAIK